MTNKRALEEERLDLLGQLGGIRTLRKGSLNEQWFPVIKGGKKTQELRGPYYIWTSKKNNKTVSERICGEQELNRARQDEENYKRFRDVCRQLESVGQELGHLERSQSAEQDALKKKRKPPSRKTPK